MDLDHLRTFRAVARAGSFTAAAEERHYAQSTVSVHVRALEAEVGAPLFDRLPAGVRPTSAGRRLLPLADRLLDLADAAAAVARHADDAGGEVTVAAPETVIAHRLPAVLRRLRDDHPGLRVRLEPLPYREIAPAVAAGVVDVGFLLQPPLRPTSALAVGWLRTEPLVMVAAADHLLATPVDDAAEAFAGTTLFLTERGCGYRSLLEAHLHHAGVRPGHVIELDSVEAIRRCVEAGLGVALLPCAWVAAPLEAGALVPMDWFASGFAVATQAVWHPGRWQAPGVRAVLAASRAGIGGEDAGARPAIPPPTAAARLG